MIKKIKNLIFEGAEKRKSLYDIYYKEDNKPKPLVIFAHGFKGYKDWGSFDLLAEKFAENDFNFLKFNFSHNGGTVENPIDFPDLEAFGNNNFSKELFDLEVIIDLAINSSDLNIDKDNIWLLGHSRGGGISIIKTLENRYIRGIITLGSISEFEKRFANIEALKVWANPICRLKVL